MRKIFFHRNHLFFTRDADAFVARGVIALVLVRDLSVRLSLYVELERACIAIIRCNLALI